MMRDTIAGGVFGLAILALAGVSAAPAAAEVYEGPWCAIVPIGEGSVAERCDMRSFEMCREEISGGAGGSCGVNPRYRGPAVDDSRRRTRPPR